MSAAARIAKVDQILTGLAARRRRTQTTAAIAAAAAAITAVAEAVAEFDEHERHRVNAVLGQTKDAQDQEAMVRQAYLTGHARATWEYNIDGDARDGEEPPTLDATVRRVLGV